MGLIELIIFGGLVGWLASIFMHNRRQGLPVNIVIGVVGSLIGGFIVKMFGGAGITGFNIYSIAVGVFGSIILIALVHAVGGQGKHA